MSLQEWDRTTGACLKSIESHAQWIALYCEDIKTHAARIEYALRMMHERPDFETKARDQLCKSIETLQLTLALCRSALEGFDMKPITVNLEAAE